MRLFCFSDTHQQPLPNCDPPPDAWLFAGDLYDKPSRRELRQSDFEFRRIAKLWTESRPQPVFAVRGNHDVVDCAGFFNTCDDLSDAGIRKLSDGLYVAGLGWAGEQFYDLPHEALMAERCAILESRMALFDGRIILLTHYPPHDPVALPYKGGDGGFYFDCLTLLIKKIHPVAVITGHIHYHFGRIAAIGGSPVICPGPTGKLLSIDGSHVTVC